MVAVMKNAHFIPTVHHHRHRHATLPVRHARRHHITSRHRHACQSSPPSPSVTRRHARYYAHAAHVTSRRHLSSPPPRHQRIYAVITLTMSREESCRFSAHERFAECRLFTMPDAIEPPYARNCRRSLSNTSVYRAAAIGCHCTIPLPPPPLPPPRMLVTAATPIFTSSRKCQLLF